MKKTMIAIALLSVPLFSEILVTSYDNGVIKKESNEVNSKREGLTKIYYKSSILKSETLFKNDKRHGLAKGYYETGILKYEKLYVKGSLHGQTKTYYKEGELKSDFVFESGIPISGNKYTPSGEIVK